MRGVFVTGTGTEVGKTVVAAAIARTLAAGGASVAVFKPAVSGLDDYAASGDLPDHQLLRLAAEEQPGVLNLFRVVRGGHQPYAGRRATADLVLQAGP